MYVLYYSLFLPIYVSGINIGIQYAVSNDFVNNYWLPTYKNIEDYNITLIPLYDDQSTYDSISNNSLDFIYGGPTLYNCIALQYNYSPVLSLELIVRNTPTIYAGSAIITRKNSSIEVIEDLLDKRIALSRLSYLTGCQAQWGEMYKHGLGLFTSSKVVIITKTFLNVILAVYSGLADVGFILAGQVETLSSQGLCPGIENFKYISLKPNNSFPWPISTDLYPNSLLMASPRVDINMKKSVAQNLFSISIDSVSAHKGNYTTWLPTINYLSVLRLQTRIGIIPDINSYTEYCVRQDNVYDTIRCSQGYEIISNTNQSCSLQNYECPSQYQCICQPCRKIPHKIFSTSTILLISIILPIIIIIVVLLILYGIFKKPKIIRELVPLNVQNKAIQVFGESCNLKLQYILGHGSFGRVYLAKWNNIDVALKITSPFNKSINEGILAETLVHDNVIKTYDHKLVEKSFLEYDSPPDQLHELWIIQEYCDGGSITKSFDSLLDSYINILYTLLDIANGLKYLYDKSIIHCDLNCNNILLLKIDTIGFDKRNFKAKIADFGMITLFQSSGNSHKSVSAYGTYSHMAPEMILHGHLSPQCDIFSFGIIMWELYNKKCVYEDNNKSDILNDVIIHNKRPHFDEYTYTEYKILAEKCWNKDKDTRPTWSYIQYTLEKMITDEMQKILKYRKASFS